MQVRAFKLLGAAELAHVQARVAAEVEAWRAEWTADAEPAVVRCRAAQDEPPGTTAELRWVTAAAGEAAVHVGQRSDSPIALQRLLFGPAAAQHPSELAAEVAQRALEALAARCLPGAEVLPGAACGPAAHDWERGSGAASAAVTWPALELRFVLDGAATARLLAGRPRATPLRRPPLSDPRAAVSGGRIEMRASTGQAEIDIATFRTLGVGDVICLDLRIDQPLRLTIGGQPTTRRAYLGTQAGRRALSLTASAEPSSAKNQEASHVRSPE